MFNVGKNITGTLMSFYELRSKCLFLKDDLLDLLGPDLAKAPRNKNGSLETCLVCTKRTGSLQMNIGSPRAPIAICSVTIESLQGH